MRKFCPSDLRGASPRSASSCFNSVTLSTDASYRPLQRDVRLDGYPEFDKRARRPFHFI